MTEQALRERLFDRFHDKYIPKPNSGCWIWIGAERKGYGRLYYKGGSKQLPYAAHRLSYEIHKGDIPTGLFVCHRCDNPSCVNPDHLYAGEPLQNTRDMYARGRAVQQKPCFYTEEIRQSDRSSRALAEQYGLHRSTVWNIRAGRTRKQQFC